MMNVHRKRNEAKEAFLKEKQSSKLISERFPDVSSIVVKMKYTSDGDVCLTRTLNFYPESYAFFKMSCLGEGCEDGGLNLTRPLTAMIKNRQKSIKGDVRCTNRDPEIPHASMSYTVAVKYA